MSYSDGNTNLSTNFINYNMLSIIVLYVIKNGGGQLKYNGTLSNLKNATYERKVIYIMNSYVPPCSNLIATMNRFFKYNDVRINLQYYIHKHYI